MSSLSKSGKRVGEEEEEEEGVEVWLAAIIDGWQYSKVANYPVYDDARSSPGDAVDASLVTSIGRVIHVVCPAEFLL